MQTEIQKTHDELFAAARMIVGLRAEIESVKRLHQAGEINDHEALHILAAIIYALDETHKRTAH